MRAGGTTGIGGFGRIAGLAALVLAAPLACHAQETAPGFPEEPVKNLEAFPPPLLLLSDPLFLGYHAPETSASGVITILNDSDETMKITEVKGDCECTIPVIDKTELAPGEATDMIVNMDFPHHLGIIRKLVFVHVEGFPTPWETMVTAEIGHPIRINGGQSKSIVVEYVGDFTVDSIDGIPFDVTHLNGRELTAEDFVDYVPGVDELKTEYTVKFDMSHLQGGNEVHRWMIVETDRPGCEMIGFPAMFPNHQKAPRSDQWFPRKTRIVHGRIDPGVGTATSLVIAGKLPDEDNRRITVSSSNPQLGARITGIRAPDYGVGMEIEFEVFPSWDAEGYQYSVLLFEMGNEFASIEYFARVRPFERPDDGPWGGDEK